ncbi:hypothetical protein Hanom_Chr00s000002g01599171 [Helianthus anomalus]
MMEGQYSNPLHGFNTGKNVLLLIDSSLEGRYADDDATVVVELALRCLQYVGRDRPDVMFLHTAVVLVSLQKQKEVKPCLLQDHLFLNTFL